MNPAASTRESASMQQGNLAGLSLLGFQVTHRLG